MKSAKPKHWPKGQEGDYVVWVEARGAWSLIPKFNPGDAEAFQALAHSFIGLLLTRECARQVELSFQQFAQRVRPELKLRVELAVGYMFVVWRYRNTSIRDLNRRVAKLERIVEQLKKESHEDW